MPDKFCSECGKEINENAIACTSCGCAIERKDELTQTNNTKTNMMALVGFILGLVSLLINLWGIIGILALVFSVVGKNQIKNTGEKGNGISTAGIVLGIIGIVYATVVLVIMIVTNL